MATTISTQDIIDAKRDIDDIGEAVNEVKIVSPRYGEDFKSLPMISAEFQISSDAAEAAAVSAAESANIAQSSANIAEAAATAATISAGVFETPEAGVDPVTGVADGAYFNVRSSNDESYIDEYQNVGGSAVATGKSYLSALGVQQQEKAASTIKDASGKSQQIINDGLESIAELRNTNPPRKGLRVYVKSYWPDLNIGGGVFVATQKAGLVDNGVTVFSSPNPLIFWVRSGIREVTPFMAGAKGDNANEDAPAFVAALSVGLPVKAEKPPVAYKLSDPITLPAASSLIGEGERVLVRVAHTGWAFTLNGNSTLSNFEPRPFDASFNYAYEAVRVLNSHTNRVINVRPFFPKVGFKLEGPSYWNRFSDIDVYLFKEYGIHVTASANNNFFDFQEIASNAPNLGGGVFDYSGITWEQAAIKCESNFNTFIGGEPAPSKFGVVIGEGAISNKFLNLYMEKHEIPLKTGKNSDTYFDCHIVDGFPDIHPDSVVTGPGGKPYSMYGNLSYPPVAGGKKLKALWYFNEGSGDRVFDYSGNNKHLTVVNPIWNDDGRWGRSIAFDRLKTTYVNNALSLSITDWSQPFSIIACVKIGDAVNLGNLIFSVRSSTGEFSLQVSPGYWSIVDYNSTTGVTTTHSSVLGKRSPQDGYVWVSVYIDPVNKVISNVDAVRGYIESSGTPTFAAWNAALAAVNIGGRSNLAFDGSISFFGIWQRRLTVSEVTDIVNMKVPNIIPSGTPIRLPTQDDTVATDVATLSSDFNALLAKMREAGLML